MSLSRLALRLAAVEALCPSAAVASGPWPTWAANRVYDSRVSPIDDADGWRNYLAQIEGKPLLTVYAEEHETEPTAGEYPADKDIAELVVEIMIAVGASVDVVGPDGATQTFGSIEAPITSAEHEATLDVLESQVRAVLDPFSHACPAPYNRVARELHHVKSVPLRDATNRLSRLAARTVTFKLRIAHAQPYGCGPGLAALPEPLLTVAKALDPMSPGGQLLRQIAANQPQAPILAPLQDLRIFSNFDRGATPTTSRNDLMSDVPL